MRRFLVLGVGASFLSGLSCRAPAEIVVDVTTDIPCTSLTRTAITVGRFPSIEGLPPATITSQCSSDGHIGSIVVVPGGADDAPVEVRVVGGKGQDVESCKAPGYGPPAPTPTGCVVARRLLSFQPHDPLYLPIVLRDACVGVPCGDAETCVDGTCQDATVRDPGLCATPNTCGESTLGSSDAGAPDAGDGGTEDAGDAGMEDAGDAGMEDAGDAGMEDAGDAGMEDAGDAGMEDAGDAGMEDAGDAGMEDAGDGGPPDAGPPGPVLEVSVSTHGTSCARTMSGRVYCWGSNDNGKMGLGGASMGGMLAVTQAMPTVPDVVGLGVGLSFFCVNSSSSGVSCAGNGIQGQLGDGVFGSSTVPQGVMSPLDMEALSLDVGDNHACAAIGQQYFCWGLGSMGQLGGTSGTSNEAMPEQSSLGGHPKSVALGGDTTCVWELPATVRCWGSNAEGQLRADPTSTPFSSTTHLVAIQGTPSSIAVGTTAACAVVNGQAQCWGQADGVDVVMTPAFATLGSLLNIQQIALGGAGGCALLQDGSVYCWGANDAGQLGQGNSDLLNTFPPVQVPGITDAVHIARSVDHVCVAHSDGTVSCWGDNTSGQVTGDGMTTSLESSPVVVPLPE